MFFRCWSYNFRKVISLLTSIYVLNLVRPLFHKVSTRKVYTINPLDYLLQWRKWSTFSGPLASSLRQSNSTSSQVFFLHFLFSYFFATYLMPSLMDCLFLIDCCAASKWWLIFVLSPITLQTLVFTGLNGTAITFDFIYAMQIIRQRMLIHQLFISLKILWGKTKCAKQYNTTNIE